MAVKVPVEAELTDWEKRQLRVLHILAGIYLRLPAEKKAAVMAEVTGTTGGQGCTTPMAAGVAEKNA